MEMFPGTTAEDQRQVWPALPQVPRYRYAGQLLGEVNFERAPGSVSAGERALRWIVGAGKRAREAQMLVRPQGGMVDTAGRILVTDVGRQAVFVFDPAAGLSVWSQADGGEDFISPLGIATGPSDEIYVADSELARIVRLDANGTPIGSFGQGIVQRPTGLVRDAGTGRTYVADTAGHNIKVFDDSRTLVDTIGVRGVAPGQFNAPTFLALTENQVVVSDTLNARVQVLSVQGEPQLVVGERGLYVGNLIRPKGVAVDDDGHIYVAESFYDHLLIFDADGRLLLPIGGSGRLPGQFFLPGGIWTDAGNRIFVADVFNSRVVIFQFLGD
ncbi:MAG: 6-bladed beta-propeller [Betaproteobacteria bacterium]|nr:MAG: 6-bladed beta-propeller [Betaproteobacteria bacterium]